MISLHFSFLSLMAINLRGLFNAKECRRTVVIPFNVEEQLWYHLTHCWRGKGVHNFPMFIRRKLNVQVGVNFESASFEAAVKKLAITHLLNICIYLLQSEFLGHFSINFSMITYPKIYPAIEIKLVSSQFGYRRRNSEYFWVICDVIPSITATPVVSSGVSQKFKNLSNPLSDKHIQSERS